MTRPWAEASEWLDAAADRAGLEQAHRANATGPVFGAFDGPATRCRAAPGEWQVSFAEQDDKGVSQPPRFFRVRWDAPYRFSLLAVGPTAFADCDEIAELPDRIGTLFPTQGWTP